MATQLCDIDGVRLPRSLARAVAQITGLLLDRVRRRLRAQHIELEFTDPAVEHLAEVGFDPEFGARPLRRAIQREVENELSRMVLGGSLAPDDLVRVDAQGGRLTFEVEQGGAEPAEDVEESEDEWRKTESPTGEHALAPRP